MNDPLWRHSYPGRLFIVEGIDGSGKSTQLQLLHKWLLSLGHSVFFTEWNSSALVKQSTKRAKKDDRLTPTTFSLLHATDFADRFVTSILPPLKAGMIVLADRYAYTAFVRGSAHLPFAPPPPRGVDRDWVRELYSFAMGPDVAFYFRVSVETSLSRLLAGRAKLKYYEAGMDLRLASDTVESFRIFQGRVIDEYERMVDESGLEVIDASLPIPRQQQRMREKVEEVLASYEPRLTA
jgi:dTMP kinase